MKKLTQYFKNTSNHSKGFALPTVVITATILMIVGVSVAQTVASVSSGLRSQSYNSLADEAAQAAVSYATSCLKKNYNSYWSSPLKPNTNCSGTSNGGSAYIQDHSASGDSPHYRASFSVSVPDSSDHAIAQGTVELVSSAGSVVKQWVSDKVVVINIITDDSNGIDITTAGEYNCAIASGKAYCWGYNNSGQLGNNSTTNSPAPVAVYSDGVLSGKTVTSISAGYYRACAVANGAAYCWGQNQYGQLGNNSTTSSTVPVAVYTGGVLSGKTVNSIVAGNTHTCAAADNLAYCWGYNAYGQLGNNSTTQSTVPVAVYTAGVLSGKAVTTVAGGYYHSCTTANGAAYCWGYNNYGQLGNSTTTNSSVPVAVTTSGVLSGKAVTAVTGGYYHTCAIASGNVYCWGYNAYGQLGNGTTTNSSAPVAVTTSGVLSGKTITAITKGSYHTCAVANGAAYCWGYNNYGQLGNNSTTTSSVPVAVNTSGVLNGKTVTAISAGDYHTCAVADGAVYCWGYNGNGELGNGTTTNSLTPVAVSPFGGSP